MLPLTDRTQLIVEKLFPSEEMRNRVRELLESECGTNLPSCENATPEVMERIRFAALKDCQGDIRKLEDAVRLAQTDWRDLLMRAEFGYDVDSYNFWFANFFE